MNRFDKNYRARMIETGMKKITKFNGEEPRLCKPTFRTVYNASIAIKTIIIDPFDKDYLQNVEFMAWLDETSSYTIKKKKDRCMAELIFPTIAMGDTAYCDLKQNMDMKVYHPSLNSRLSDDMPGTSQKNILDEEMTKFEPTGNIYERVIVLEGATKADRAKLKDEEKLSHVFPDALNILSFEYDPRCAGIVALELQSVAAANKFIKEHRTREKFKLDDEDVEVDIFRYNERAPTYEKIRETDTANQDFRMQFVKEDLGDQRRVEINDEYHQLSKKMEKVHTMDELFGEQKVQKYMDLVTEMRECKRLLCKDTRRRLKDEVLKLPEPDDMMQLFTLNLIKNHKGFVGSVDQDRVKKQLEEYDQAYEDIMKEAEKIKQKISSVVGQLDPQEKLKRQAAQWAKGGFVEHMSGKKSNEMKTNERRANEKKAYEKKTNEKKVNEIAQNAPKPPSLMSVTVGIPSAKAVKRPATQSSMFNDGIAPKKGHIARNELFPSNSGIQGFGNSGSKINTPASVMETNTIQAFKQGIVGNPYDNTKSLFNKPTSLFESSVDTFRKPGSLMDSSFNRPVGRMMDPAFDKPVGLMNNTLVNRQIETRNTPSSILDFDPIDRQRNLQYGFSQPGMSALGSRGMPGIPSDADIEIRARLAVAERKKALLQKFSMLKRNATNLRDSMYLKGMADLGYGDMDIDRDTTPTEFEYVSPYS